VSIFEKTPDTASFDKSISGNGMVIAKFQTSTCVICRRLEPGLKQMTDRLNETLRVIDVDLEEIAELGERYDIRGVPTLILFSNGRELNRCNGFQSSSMLRDWVAPYITGGD
jgi:thioredoxin-like negative regulator of GroEL